ncbi:MAG: RimK family alpha-L-glutamate ligase [Actinomycetota bacterium]
MRPVTHPIAILYEHPLWFNPLFTELDRRGVQYRPVDVSDDRADLHEALEGCGLVVNRMSPSAWARGNGPAIGRTQELLRRLEADGVPVINAARAFEYETSKIRQLELLAELGVDHPKGRPFSNPSEAVEAAAGLRFPVLVKPNLGGSGAGIRSFDDPDELKAATLSGDLENLSYDGLALVQEHLPAEGDSIVRIEILDGDHLYAIRLRLLPGSFNLCPADYCDLPGVADGVSGRGLPVEAFTPPEDVIETAKKIIGAAEMDLGGVEYLVDSRDGRPYFYDVNALSNFVADAPNVIGFDPFEDLANFIVRRAQDIEGAMAGQPIR